LAKCHKKIVAFDLLLSTQQSLNIQANLQEADRNPTLLCTPGPTPPTQIQIDLRYLTTLKISSLTALGEDADNMTTIREPLTEQHPAQPLRASA